MPLSVRYAFVAITIALASCTSPHSAASPTALPKIVGVPRARLAAGLVSALPAAYTSADWNAVQAWFAVPGPARLLVARMRTWKQDSVPRIDVRLISETPVRHGEYVGTLQFSYDPRAIPYYAVYVFRGRDGSARIVGTATGVNGETYAQANWVVSYSEHFTVYHSRYEPAGRLRGVLADLEYQRRQFVSKFGVSVASRIRYYWYPDRRLMSVLTKYACGSSPGLVGCAFPDSHPPQIHTSEWPTYHEPIHVYERALEPPIQGRTEYVAPLFIAEGAAVALEDREVDPRLSDYCSDLVYIPLDSCAQQGIQDVQPITLLADSGFKHANSGDAYSLGGSFVKYLILHFGYRQFGRFYYVLAAQPSDRERDYDVAANRVYHRSIHALIANWTDNLCRSGGC